MSNCLCVCVRWVCAKNGYNFFFMSVKITSRKHCIKCEPLTMMIDHKWKVISLDRINALVATQQTRGYSIIRGDRNKCEQSA